MIIETTTATGYMSYLEHSSQKATQTISMTAGDYHYMEARHYEKSGTDHFSIAVHIAQS